jgi:hypothetical protein
VLFKTIVCLSHYGHIRDLPVITLAEGGEIDTDNRRPRGAVSIMLGRLWPRLLQSAELPVRDEDEYGLRVIADARRSSLVE